MDDGSRVVRVVYTNWKGETAIRHIIPIEIYFGSNEWHTEEQWLLLAFDVDKEAERTFALKDIHTWKGTPRPIGSLGEKAKDCLDSPSRSRRAPPARRLAAVSR